MLTCPADTRSPAGDAYPPDTEWAASLIDQPYSAVNSGVPVVGLVRAVDGRQILAWEPGNGYWTDVAKERLDQLGAPQEGHDQCSHLTRAT